MKKILAMIVAIMMVLAMVEADDVETVLQSNFLRIYRTAKARQKQYEALSASVKEFTKELTEKKDLNLLGSPNV